jgi:hypothetical protein
MVIIQTIPSRVQYVREKTSYAHELRDNQVRFGGTRTWQRFR